ncbi:MAG TPA: 4Fe-4S binding protein [Gemmataceae bacterium]|nr:4Fe-4S binding protein [Gemmataceae bacterium]
MAKVRPPAGLVPGPDDEVLTVEQLEKISLFQDLAEQPGLEEFPGTVVLRHYRKGDVICRLGDPGWTAFYILTPQDLRELREPQGRPASEAEQAAPRRVATAHLGWPENRWERLQRWPLSLLGRAPAPSRQQQAGMGEGELFGEMSCLYRTPRAATVVADADFYALEMLRNIFRNMLTNRNRAFKDQVDKVYRERVLALHVPSLPLFAGLSPEQAGELCRRVELQSFEPGELIFDEHEAAESMYLVRSGFVQVRKNASALLGGNDVTDWPKFCAGLSAGREGLTCESSGERGKTALPARKVWEMLKPAQAAILKAAGGAEPEAAERVAILAAVNGLLRQPKLVAAPELQDVLASTGLSAEAKNLPAAVKKWASYRQVVLLNRQLLEAVFRDSFPVLRRTEEDARVLAYRGPGDYIGEIGLVMGTPRTAACIAYDHPACKFGRVELVRIGKQLFEDIMAASPSLRTRVRGVVDERLRETRQRVEQPAWDDTNSAVLSQRFDELGLIQGTKLMLIDLDRCTRCDECVKACVATHSDGRSRLFLDGPRFRSHAPDGFHNYLVPATCRQCKDPVCLIDCPVGSIHKGDNGQIVIENWCIGCNRCAEQCPYGSILMYPVGVLPRRSGGWRFRPAPTGTQESDPWYAPAYDDASWKVGQTPFFYNRELRDQLASARGEQQGVKPSPFPEVQFRRAFEVSEALVGNGPRFQLQVLSLAPQVSVWLNGQVLGSETLRRLPKPIREKDEIWNLAAELTAGQQLHVGRNLLAVSASATAKVSDVLLNLGLYQRVKPVVAREVSGEEVNQEIVMNTAVVCDMCSDQFGKRPACVNACPHDAALRVDARQLPFRPR